MLTIINKVLSDADNKNLLYNILVAFLVKGVSLFVSLFSMPLYIKYFNDDAVLGMWYTIISMLSWINLCELGLGNGLRNRLTEALALKEYDRAKSFISATYIVLCRIIMPVMIIIYVVFQFANFNRFFNISNSIISGKSIKLAMIILILGVCINFIVKIINNIIYAMQKASLNNIITLISSILPLIFILFYNGKDVEENLISLSVVHVFAINLPLIIATIVLFNKEPLKNCRPMIKGVSKNVIREILAFGLKFFMAQVFFMFLMQTNEIIITNLFSPEYVVEYSIYYKLFMTIGSLFMLALTPMWSKVTKDLAQKNFQRIKNTNKILCLIAIVACACEILAVPFIQVIIDIWLKDNAISVDYKVALLFGIYGGVYIFNIVLTTVANGIGKIESQIIFYGIGTIGKIPMIYLIKQYINHWSITIVYNIGILILFCIFQYMWINKKIDNLIEQEE